MVIKIITLVISGNWTGQTASLQGPATGHETQVTEFGEQLHSLGLAEQNEDPKI